jgi:hypothetical protein
MHKKWFCLLCAALLTLGSGTAFASHDKDDEHGHGHAYGHEKHDRDGDDDRDHYRDHDRELREWYEDHRGHLPPGLAKRDQLPPGLERQLVIAARCLQGYESRCILARLR